MDEGFHNVLQSICSAKLGWSSYYMEVNLASCGGGYYRKCGSQRISQCVECNLYCETWILASCGARYYRKWWMKVDVSQCVECNL